MSYRKNIGDGKLNFAYRLFRSIMFYHMLSMARDLDYSLQLKQNFLSF